MSEVQYVMTVHVVWALPRPSVLLLSAHSPEVEFLLYGIYMTWELLLSDLFLDLTERDVQDAAWPESLGCQRAFLTSEFG